MSTTTVSPTSPVSNHGLSAGLPAAVRIALATGIVGLRAETACAAFTPTVDGRELFNLVAANGCPERIAHLSTKILSRRVDSIQSVLDLCIVANIEFRGAEAWRSVAAATAAIAFLSRLAGIKI